MSTLSKKMKARRVKDMSTAQLMRRAASYQAARPQYRALVGRQTGELKGVDTVLSLSPIISTTNTNASSFVLNLIDPGTGSYNRIGRKVGMKSLRLKGSISFNYTPSATGVVVGNNVRMVVVWDKQTNGALPVWSDIFGYTPQNGTEASTIMSQPRYDNMARFQILSDRIIEPQTLVGNVASTGTVEQQASFDVYLSLAGKVTTYGGQTVSQTIADISTGGLYVFFRAANNTASNIAVVDADSVARLRYID